MADPNHPGDLMPETIDMIADDSNAPSFGGGATRVLSENELDGLIEATVSASDVNHPRAPKETKRIEALARIEPKTTASDAGGETQAAAAEAALLDAAYSGASIVVDPSATQPTPSAARHPHAPAPARRVFWLMLLVAAAIGGAAAVHMLLHR
jgi:hypothetical protein